MVIFFDPVRYACICVLTLEYPLVTTSLIVKNSAGSSIVVVGKIHLPPIPPTVAADLDSTNGVPAPATPSPIPINFLSL